MTNDEKDKASKKEKASNSSKTGFQKAREQVKEKIQVRRIINEDPEANKKKSSEK